MYLIISTDDGFYKERDISDEDKIKCEQGEHDIIDLSESEYPKYYADGGWHYV